MENLTLTGKSETASEAAGNMAAQVATSAANLLDATKGAGKNIGVVAHQEVSGLRADLDNLLANLSSYSELELIAAKENILAKVEATKVAARGVTADVSQQFNRGVDVTTEYVKERPLQSVGIAAAIGVLVGMLISRR
ncbi:YqjD family protein [Rhodoferax sp.]|uniref:DUF883 family protein n=1 Tax=Rhodoferax sp. TaxID=50421 RepID=UPI002726620B|nr:DUF883 domain-containing protein [Rhodoferax sp.]MDO9199395.1 DUF883 domain-containing protein [Rhodoferax sp.]